MYARWPCALGLRWAGTAALAAAALLLGCEPLDQPPDRNDPPPGGSDQPEQPAPVDDPIGTIVREIGPISITADNQILVELADDEATAPNLFDLNERTLVFRPDGQGGYSREVRALTWDTDIGAGVADGEMIDLRAFTFNFAGREWGSLYLNRHGVVTFGAPHAYEYWDSENRFDALREIAEKFVTTPTISALYKPMLGGRHDRYGATQHVRQRSDRVVITWITSEPDYWEYGERPANPARIQAVLGADGSIRISYLDVTLGDGIVGLFPDRGNYHGTTDLSQAVPGFTRSQHEVFHYRSLPNLRDLTCRLVDILGDGFDLFVFHNEFRVDFQESATPWNGRDAGASGIGVHPGEGHICGSDRLKGHWVLPVWMKSDHVLNRTRYHDERGPYDRGLLLFAHEFTHAWTAHATYERNGQREPLYGNYCRCHWREDLHAPAAFPWHEEDAGPRSLMGGRYWRENADRTYTPLDGYWGGGHSWLDLYLMGLAEASEVPDMFILRNLQAVSATRGRYGPHRGEKETVTIEQVIAAEGPRIPSAKDARKDFNAGFVYLLAPGKAPTPDLLRLHRDYRDKVVEHWRHVTGRRSRITTTIP